MFLVDTNVLLDVATNDSRWASWSLHALEAAALRGDLLINAIVYAEFSVGYTRIEEADAALETSRIEIADIPRAALFLAGKVFADHRRRRGQRTSVLPDFFVGAHAAVAGLTLITRDVARYRTNFPSVGLVTPA